MCNVSSASRSPPLPGHNSCLPTPTPTRLPACLPQMPFNLNCSLIASSRSPPRPSVPSGLPPLTFSNYCRAPWQNRRAEGRHRRLQMEPKKAGHARQSPCHLSSERMAFIEKAQEGRGCWTGSQFKCEVPIPGPSAAPLPHRRWRNPRSC